MSLLISIQCWSAQFKPGEPTQKALEKSGIVSTDSIIQRLSKVLRLLNDEEYFQPKQQTESDYNLDAGRTADEILFQKKGGWCRSSAIAAAAILEASGVKKKDIYLVEAVVNDELKKVCPQSGKAVLKNDESLSGHVFILIKDKERWILVNATDSSKNPDIISFQSPTELAQQMKDHPVQIPQEAYQTMMKIPNVHKTFKSGLTVFGVSPMDQVPKHTFQQRYNLVASGNLHNSVCRYGQNEVNHEIKRLAKSKKSRDNESNPSRDSSGNLFSLPAR